MDNADFLKFFDKIKQTVIQHLGESGGCHDIDHTMRVVNNAESLAGKLPEADMQTVLLAALLHDIARPEETASKGKICHAALGAEMAEKILLSNGLAPAQAAAAGECIRTHRYRSGEKPQTLEAQIVYDADKIDSLGASGIGRAFLFAGANGAKLHNSKAEALAASEYSPGDTAYREYLVKLSKLPGVMLTAPGRETAKARAAFMDEFFRELNRECGENGEA